MPTSFKCPSCALPLEYSERSFRCINNHSFDLAKEGYVNLLLAQHKKSKNPGDNKTMMLCRRAFLEAGHYDFLVEAIAELLRIQAPKSILDIGCGEGFYLNALKAHLDFEAHGLDIAKEGVRLAAKRKTFASLAVASAYDLPFNNNSFDAAISIFSPLQAEQSARCLKPGGTLIAVSPSANHLQGLAECIYENFRPHKTITPLGKPLWLLERESQVSQTLTIKGEHIYNLLTMTPYFWSCSQKKQADLKTLKELTTPVNFTLRVYKKNSL